MPFVASEFDNLHKTIKYSNTYDSFGLFSFYTFYTIIYDTFPIWLNVDSKYEINPILAMHSDGDIQIIAFQ